MRQPIEFLADVSEYGDVVTYRIAGQRFTAHLHPDYIEQVLVRENDRFRRWSGEEWGYVRRVRDGGPRVEIGAERR